jgi:cell division protein FtsI/penicillin-binding protein 2
VTPLQLAVAYCALANNGKLLKPYIVEEIRYPSGKIEKTAVKVIDNVISSRASKLITGMLVSVVDNGQARNASVPGYYIAGKTGTAQIAGVGGYTEETNHTFVGFAPADNPKFVLVIKYEKPQRAWADSTTAPTFADIAKFTLQYYGIPEER